MNELNCMISSISDTSSNSCSFGKNDNDEIKNSEYICSFVSDNNLVKEYIKTNYCHKFNVNLLVVPHNLISQWSSYIENDTTYKYKILSKKKD